MSGKKNATYLTDHLYEAKAENARFLLNDCGLHIDLVAKRLGMTRDGIEKLLTKH
jgi:hypothetical protein